MTAKIIDGKAMAAGLRARVGEGVAAVKAAHGITPGLAVVLVGDDPASEVYVRNKGKMTVEAGMASFSFSLPDDTSQEALLAKVKELNADARVHGILVQLPLPKHIDENAIINAIDPAKDVDGFHVINTGKLVSAQKDAMVPCTPLGCLMMLKSVFTSPNGRGRSNAGASGEGMLSGKHAVVIGRSNIVGKPMAALLLNESCTVTICHSRTKNLAEEVKRADIVIAAVGRPNMVQADWVKEGAVVIDVGINRIPDEREGADAGKMRLVGDVDYDAVAPVASAITPVPGGVGPMTIACLLRNTLQAACNQAGVVFPLQD